MIVIDIKRKKSIGISFGIHKKISICKFLRTINVCLWLMKMLSVQRHILIILSPHRSWGKNFLAVYLNHIFTVTVGLWLCLSWFVRQRRRWCWQDVCGWIDISHPLRQHFFLIRFYNKSVENSLFWLFLKTNWWSIQTLIFDLEIIHKKT
jgi:hypothetical protein